MSHAPAFFDHPGPIAFAHRGGPAPGLENSLVAFQRAVDVGYRYLETDVQATADGVPLTFHDPVLGRVTDHHGRVADMPYRDVAKARIGGLEPIPRLDEVLGTWPDVRVNIDVKSASAIGPLCESLRRTNAWDRVCVASFSRHRLASVKARMRALCPREVCTALAPGTLLALWIKSAGSLVGWLVRLASSGAVCAQVPESIGRLRVVTPGFLATAHTLGIPVHVWTVNDRAAMERLLDLGVDGIMTDSIYTLRDVLEARDMWYPCRPDGG